SDFLRQHQHGILRFDRQFRSRLPMAYRIRLTVLATLLATACGLDVVGIEALDGSAPEPEAGVPESASPPTDANIADGGETDGSIDADSEVPDTGPTDACASTCPATTALTETDAGFFAVYYADTPDAGCPTGLTQLDIVENPVAQPGSCACAPCAVTANCNAG